jgi:hypothetical protein
MKIMSNETGNLREILSKMTVSDLWHCLIEFMEEIGILCVFNVSVTQHRNSKFDENKAAFIGKRVGEGIEH